MEASRLVGLVVTLACAFSIHTVSASCLMSTSNGLMTGHCRTCVLNNSPKVDGGCRWCWSEHRFGCDRTGDDCPTHYRVDGLLAGVKPSLAVARSLMDQCKGAPADSVTTAADAVTTMSAHVLIALRTCTRDAIFTADQAMQELQASHQSHIRQLKSPLLPDARELKQPTDISGQAAKAAMDGIHTYGAACFAKDPTLALKIVRQTAGNFAKRFVVGEQHQAFLENLVAVGDAAFGKGRIVVECSLADDQCGRIAYLDRAAHVLYLCADPHEIRIEGGRAKCGTGYVTAARNDGFVTYKDETPTAQ